MAQASLQASAPPSTCFFFCLFGPNVAVCGDYLASQLFLGGHVRGFFVPRELEAQLLELELQVAQPLLTKILAGCRSASLRLDRTRQRREKKKNITTTFFSSSLPLLTPPIPFLRGETKSTASFFFSFFYLVDSFVSCFPPILQRPSATCTPSQLSQHLAHELPTTSATTPLKQATAKLRVLPANHFQPLISHTPPSSPPRPRVSNPNQGSRLRHNIQHIMASQAAPAEKLAAAADASAGAASSSEVAAPKQQKKQHRKELYPMVNWKYDLFLYVMGNVADLFFREVVSRGSWKVPQSGPVLFVAGPHANQVSSSFPRMISMSTCRVNSFPTPAHLRLLTRTPLVCRRPRPPTNPPQGSRPPRLPPHRPKVGPRLHRLGLAPGLLRPRRPRPGRRQARLRHHLPARPRQRPDPRPRRRHQVWPGRGRDPGHALHALGQGRLGREHEH